MRDVRDMLEARARWSSQELVMATVVDVAGSSYRQPGARMLVNRAGKRVGLISGGCLERDLVRNAFEKTEDGPVTVVYDTRGDRLDPSGRWGSGCDGVVHLFLERLTPQQDADPAMRALEETLERRTSRVLATLFAGAGRCSKQVGLKIVAGRTDGGFAEQLPDEIGTEFNEVLKEAADWRRPRTVRLESGEDKAAFLVEPLHPPVDLLVFGAGDDAQPVARMATELGWDVRVAGLKPVWTTRERFPTAREIRCAPAEKLLEEVDVAADTHVLVMTHDFEADVELVPQLLDKDPAFVGLLGPKRRTARLVEQLHRRGTLPDPEVIERLQTPLGVDLGGEAPAEVALSVLAGVLAERNERTGGLLQDRGASIHDEHRRITRRLGEGR